MSLFALENATVWQSADIVAEYAGFDHLQAPERTILALLRNCLSGSRMLDIGVGAGRTMLHFAPLVREYWGIDYSPTMIAASNARWPVGLAHVSLEVCDARAMTIFPNGFSISFSPASTASIMFRTRTGYVYSKR
jgi:ubiquinone/menaquinone biosynthesis C-methylase UbiE